MRTPPVCLTSEHTLPFVLFSYNAARTAAKNSLVLAFPPWSEVSVLPWR